MSLEPVIVGVEDESGKYRNVLSIAPNANGSFSIQVPRHSAKEAFLCKMKRPRQADDLAELPDLIEVARDDASLVFSPDGFVRFILNDGEKAVAGRNEAGEIWGLGIMRPPFAEPTGSTAFGLIAFGLSDFEESDSPDEIKFPRRELYHRGRTTGSDPNGIAIEGVLFESGFWEAVRGTPPDSRFLVRYRGSGIGFATVEARVIPLATSEVFLGIFANHLPVRFAAKSGFSLNSQGKDDDALIAIYPKGRGRIKTVGTRNLASVGGGRP